VDQFFLDANVLFSAAYRLDMPLRKLFSLPKVMLVMSSYALEEAKRNLASGQQRAELEQMCKSIEVVTVLPLEGESPILAQLPENDRPILWAAITVRATHLLSGDFKAFGRFYGQTIEGVAIMPPAEYLKGHRR
jgi:hypothetical protein